tara:strand:- start:93348 stop:93764 length:417 start_codon:yes stop_codon:yes gene_type:complete
METIWLPLAGGVLIGLASTLMLLGLGKITGISGIFASSLLEKFKPHESWRYFFIGGLLLGGLLMKTLRPDFFDYNLGSSIPMMIAAGLIVGFGTRLGSGCTSGHGVCGLSRKSARSFVATITFMFFGVITVLIKGLLL